MSSTMKVLIGYDASECADAAIDELVRAGMPASAEALVVTMAEVWVQEVVVGESVPGEEPKTTYLPPASEHAQRGLEIATMHAERGARRLQELFPGWSIETRVYPDSPAWGILRAEDEWKPDLIVVGSQGRSAIGRFILGSASQKVLTEARCSVRVSRSHDEVAGSPVRIVVGVDGTPDSVAAVEAIASRTWPEQSSVRVVAAVGSLYMPIGVAFDFDVTQWEHNGTVQERERLEKAANEAAGKLRAAGLVADTLVREDAPVALILSEAQELGADCIFIGARGHRFMERFLLGSVSGAVAARAHCSVEVTRH